ncbi:AraC family transcriptional regulator [Pollutibacter soli]|uniref:AraC family transcriptional regulator n=1 Tax=Pollutibacter soli TaxID=3034157 RepID=UPI0030134378
MRIIPFQIPRTTSEAFRLQTDDQPRLYDHLHQHTEIQLTAIVSSEGTLLAGEFMGRFKPGDVFLIGSNLPHVFRNDPEYGKGQANAKTISVYFNEHMLGETFWNLPETKSLFQLLNNAQHAFQLQGAKADLVMQELEQLQDSEGMHKILLFLQVLSHFEDEEDLVMLAGQRTRKHLNVYDQERINRILEFTFSDFNRAITLEEVSAIANLSVAAFCKYFKTRTGKSYITFLSELRIQHACKLLKETKHSVMDVAFMSGFSNLSHFNRIFRKYSFMTPTQFRAC